ncbi:MAG: nucleotide exchange factor GrpE [Rhodospirillaceae bacterium]|nr:nucleotide exchange factor GrpE [Rhodospirillaceae bacterium]
MNDETKRNPEAAEAVATPKPANDDSDVAAEDDVVEVGGEADVMEDGFDEADDEFFAGEVDEDADEPEHDRVAELEGQVSDLTDRLLRTAAEMENVRKTAQRDRENASKYATQKFAEDILAVADNLSRALEAVTEDARKDSAAKGLIEGVDLTMRELAVALERHGIKEIEATGTKFDPNLHQAMFETETADVEPGMVMQVLRTGYTIHDRLLRPAMVGVAKAPAAAKDEG